MKRSPAKIGLLAKEPLKMGVLPQRPHGVCVYANTCLYIYINTYVHIYTCTQMCEYIHIYI